MKNYKPVFLILIAVSIISNCTTKQSTATADKKIEMILPQPYATPDTIKECKVIGWPEDKIPMAPEEFIVTKFASGLNNPRWIYVLPNNDILISEAKTKKEESANDIILFRDENGDGNPEIRKIFLKNLNQPLGMLLLNNWLYVGNTDGIYRYSYIPGQLQINDTGEKIMDLPAGGYNNHWTRNIISNIDSSKLYVSVGSGSNVGENGLENEIGRAVILEINPDGSGERIFASGIRNPVGLAIEPVSGKLWTTVNERDNLGDDLVPDYFTSVKEGSFYGWPYAYWGANEDPRLKGQHPDLVAKTIVPDVDLGAHTASLGLAFYTNKQFSKKYHGGAFISQHGSWNRSRFAGYKVVFVPFEKGIPGKPEDFLTGFIKDDNKNLVFGRPVGIAILKDGSMLVADDEGNTIWRVSAKIK
ncbi:MAG: sorbosone dehydrogenase family protein [Bacteroidetes bacterium]|nr:MAG: sorbosone dehydrogenase family protein [Bacteroidota bacterium]